MLIFERTERHRYKQNIVTQTLIQRALRKACEVNVEIRRAVTDFDA